MASRLELGYWRSDEVDFSTVGNADIFIPPLPGKKLHVWQLRFEPTFKSGSGVDAIIVIGTNVSTYPNNLVDFYRCTGFVGEEYDIPFGLDDGGYPILDLTQGLQVLVDTAPSGSKVMSARFHIVASIV